jgi:thiamine-phosphate diphosphorylase
VVCMITGHAHSASSPHETIERIAAAASAGVDLVQIRARHLEAAALVALVEQSVRAVRGSRARIVVNDRLDAALGAGAHGLHLRGDSPPASRVRTLTPRGFIVGRSVHDTAGAAEVTSGGGLDYLIFGTVFKTAAKAGHEPAGVARLAEVVSTTPLPVLAVGGVGLDQVHAVAAAGASGFAAISLFADPPLERLTEIVRTVRATFRLAA